MVKDTGVRDRRICERTFRERCGTGMGGDGRVFRVTTQP